MNRFRKALVRVMMEVHNEFSSDDRLLTWLADVNTTCSRQSEETLDRLIGNLNSGWVSTMLVNEDVEEERSLLAESLLTEIRSFDRESVSRSQFAYQLANCIVNKGVRPLNRSAQHLQKNSAVDVFIEMSTPALTYPSDLEIERYDKAVEALLSRSTRSDEVASARITMDVKRAWEGALRKVDAELGGAKAKPMSLAVKKAIAEQLDLPITTVEAAMKRYKRAIRRVRAAENEGNSA